MEVSSRALARDPDPPISILELMRAQGIRVTLDDATDEDAHLVEKLPVDIVKVSRALVSRMGRDHRALEYVRVLVSAARGRASRRSQSESKTRRLGTGSSSLGSPAPRAISSQRRCHQYN